LTASEGLSATSASSAVASLASVASAASWAESALLVALDSTAFGLVGQTGLVGLIGYNGLVGRIIQNGLVDRNNLVGPIGFSDISGLIDRISLVGPIGFSGVIGLVGQISLGISLASLIGLVGQIGFGFVRLISLGDLSVISLINLSASANHWPNVIGFGLIGLVGSSALSAHQLIGLISFVIAAKTISRQLKHAASHGVAALRISASEIVNAATANYAASSLNVREGEDVLVALYREEKDVVVDCLFWRILQR